MLIWNSVLFTIHLLLEGFWFPWLNCVIYNDGFKCNRDRKPFRYLQATIWIKRYWPIRFIYYIHMIDCAVTLICFRLVYYLFITVISVIFILNLYPLRLFYNCWNFPEYVLDCETDGYSLSYQWEWLHSVVRTRVTFIYAYIIHKHDSLNSIYRLLISVQKFILYNIKFQPVVGNDSMIIPTWIRQVKCVIFWKYVRAKIMQRFMSMLAVQV